jgi:hypothetical protein
MKGPAIPHPLVTPSRAPVSLGSRQRRLYSAAPRGDSLRPLGRQLTGLGGKAILPQEGKLGSLCAAGIVPVTRLHFLPTPGPCAQRLHAPRRELGGDLA